MNNYETGWSKALNDLAGRHRRLYHAVVHLIGPLSREEVAALRQHLTATEIGSHTWHLTHVIELVRLALPVPEEPENAPRRA